MSTRIKHPIILLLGIFLIATNNKNIYGTEPATTEQGCFIEWKVRIEKLWQEPLISESPKIYSSNLVWMEEDPLRLHAQEIISLISLELIGSAFLDKTQQATLSLEQRIEEAINQHNYLKQMHKTYTYMPLAMIEIYENDRLITFTSLNYGNIEILEPRDNYTKMLLPQLERKSFIIHAAPDLSKAGSRELLVEKIINTDAISISAWLPCPGKEPCQFRWLKIRLIYFNLRPYCVHCCPR